MIELILPYPPSVNHYKTVGRLRTTASGKTYQARINSDETKRFYYEVWLKVQQMKAKYELIPIMDASVALSVEIDLYPATNHRQDIDNRVKAILDALVRSQVFPDDSQVARLLVQRCSIIQGGQIIVRIESI